MDLLDVPAWGDTPDLGYPTFQLPSCKPGPPGTTVGRPTSQTAKKSKRPSKPSKHPQALSLEHAAADRNCRSGAEMERCLHPKEASPSHGPIKSTVVDHPSASSRSEQQQPSGRQIHGKRKRTNADDAQSWPQKGQSASVPDNGAIRSRPFTQAQQQQPSSRQKTTKHKHTKRAGALPSSSNAQPASLLQIGSMQSRQAAELQHAGMIAIHKQKYRKQQESDAAVGPLQPVSLSPEANSISHPPASQATVRHSRKQAQKRARQCEPGTAASPSRVRHQQPSVGWTGLRSDVGPCSKPPATSRKLARLENLKAQNMVPPAAINGFHSHAAAHEIAGMPSSQPPQSRKAVRDQDFLVPDRHEPAASAAGDCHDNHDAHNPSTSKQRKKLPRQSKPEPDASAGLQQDGTSHETTTTHDQKPLRQQQLQTSQHQLGKPSAGHAREPSRPAAADENAQHRSAPAPVAHRNAKVASSRKRPGSGLLDQMRAKLSGGHFRWLNERLYTTTGDAALDFMTTNPSQFDEYHKGFRQQTAHWPARPLDAIITRLQQLPASFKVADFGCGDAELAATVTQPVSSFDLVATTPGTIACNMAHVPLDDASMDVAVFCLALMGTDYPSFLREAQRVLRPNGILWIAEVSSRFQPDTEPGFGTSKHDSSSGQFVKALESSGFKLRSRDHANKMFVVWELSKARCAVSFAKPGLWPALKACSYKKR